MISDLNALKEYMAYRAERTPRLKDRFALTSPGCDQNGLAKIKNTFPTIPESYLACARDLHLNGVTIGYFLLSPLGPKKLDFVESVLKINTPENNPFWNFMVEKSLYQVATWEAEPICVATHKSTYTDGAVLKISIAQPTPKEALLANDFETFLLIAGNLDAIRDNYSKIRDRTIADAEFDHCLKHFELPVEAITHWKTISEVVLK